MTAATGEREVIGGNLLDTGGEGVLMRWPLEAILESPLNPRQHYDPQALEELAHSLSRSGQIEPGLARPVPGSTVEWQGDVYQVVELAAGHRRFRALTLTGARQMRLEIREMADEEFIEILQVSNLQRDDLTPLEEARGYRLLMDRIGYDIGRIADRVGRARSYVYDRLKLLRLIEPAQALLAARRFELGHAVLLARLSPEDQARAIASERSGNGRVGGLFVTEHVGLFSEHEEQEFEEGIASEDPVKRTTGLKPVSVREFQHWIDDHVRFRPEAEDLPELFPETAEALAGARETEAKIVKITRDNLLSHDAKDPAERTYGNRSWKRADGQVAEPVFSWLKNQDTPATCEHSVLGVVVAGPGRGEAFDVCVEKKKCAVHWGAEMREAKKRARQLAGLPAQERKAQEAEQQRARREREAREEEQRKRWEKARPAILQAVTDKLQGAAAELAGPIALSIVRWWVKVPEALKGRTPEHVIRQIAYAQISDGLRASWQASKEWPKVVGPLGINAQQIVDQVAGDAPQAKPKAKPKTKPAKGKRLAGDVRRARASKKAAP